MPLPQQVGYPPHSGTIRMKVPKSPARSMGLPSPFALALALVMGAALLATATVSAAQPLLFNQAAVKANTATSGFGPDASKPHFTVRFAMPIPPDNDYSNRGGAMVGIDEAVADYNHSTSFPRPPVQPPALSTAFTPKANSCRHLLGGLLVSAEAPRTVPEAARTRRTHHPGTEDQECERSLKPNANV
jgi:hypothetical protein